MTDLPQRQTVEELGLKDEELVQLYLELIRIIEKDIDELKAGVAGVHRFVGHLVSLCRPIYASGLLPLGTKDHERS